LALALSARGFGWVSSMPTSRTERAAHDRRSDAAAHARGEEDRSDRALRIALVSMGFFLDDRSPVIWRGPMVMSIVRQFLRDVVWGELDVLVVDLPPGTGDAQLTLLQEVPIAAASS
jgi:Mrp family chromosome partitioning ATPase